MRTTLEITRGALVDQKRSLIWWVIGFVALVLLVVVSWPAVKNLGDIDNFAKDLPDAAKDLFGLGRSLTSPAGYLDSQLFAYFLPAILLVYGVARGAKSIAGEEEDLRLELLSSLPVSRTRIVLEKAIAIVMGLLIISVPVYVVLLVGSELVDLPIGTAQLTAAMLGAFLASVVGALSALFIGCALGRSGLALGLSTAWIAGGYALGGLSAAIEGLRPLQAVSLLYWARRGEPLVNGLQFTSMLALVVAAIVFLLLAVVTFNRRDLKL